MKKFLTFILLFFSFITYSQSEQDYQLLKLINEERISNCSTTLDLYDNYTDFEYFVNYKLRLKNTSEKEIKRCVNHINNFIDEHYHNANRVYYGAICTKEQPTHYSLIKVLIKSSNFPHYGSSHTMPKIILYQSGGKWVAFVYILTFDI
jgi:hypothetical protein